MNRSKNFDYIEEKLNSLSYRIKNRGRINLLDLNIYSESFFAELVNNMLGYKLKNANLKKQNTEGIDLIDEENKIIAQVSSTCSKQKIESSLNKKIFKDYPDYRFIFIAIVGDADKLKSKNIANPYNVNFSPTEDIYDIKDLLNLILSMSIGEQRRLYEFLKDELGNNIDIVKVDTNLSSIINILSKEDLVCINDPHVINSFEIYRKIEFNDLLKVQPTIEDYKIYYSKIEEKYNEFDKQGANKSLAVLSIMRSQYIKISSIIDDPQEIFFAIIDKVIEIIQESKNYIEIPYEELEMCVSAIVVDAFIRCKIFKNPEGYNHVITR